MGKKAATAVRAASKKPEAALLSQEKHGKEACYNRLNCGGHRWDDQRDWYSAA